MPSLLNEVMEWLDRAEQAREVAGQLIDPTARKAVLELADSFDRLARTAARLASGECRGWDGQAAAGWGSDCFQCQGNSSCSLAAG